MKQDPENGNMPGDMYICPHFTNIFSINVAFLFVCFFTTPTNFGIYFLFAFASDDRCVINLIFLFHLKFSNLWGRGVLQADNLRSDPCVLLYYRESGY